ncbi:MAG: hypothetical protein DRQ46_00005 [Gammaproteobacteria bacterium]|nr:MAG: hypothetical protein DRQ46_00005 [Gammaproteobacteria bacterium]
MNATINNISRNTVRKMLAKEHQLEIIMKTEEEYRKFDAFISVMHSLDLDTSEAHAINAGTLDQYADAIKKATSPSVFLQREVESCLPASWLYRFDSLAQRLSGVEKESITVDQKLKCAFFEEK